MPIRCERDRAVERASVENSGPGAQFQDCADLATLRAAIERLPCCAIDARDKMQGDSLNVVLVGEVCRHWDGGAVASLHPSRREAWLARNRLPPDLRLLLARNIPAARADLFDSYLELQRATTS